ncbi:hypothetical protein BLOT_000290 [Blomia tropicalis]|nr:hypothetical protein BLOT_000290 [Blomia tropicalis]
MVATELAETMVKGKLNDDLSIWNRLNELKFIHGFIASFSVIIVSELGDKTFFIAAIMAMRHPRFTVFLAAMFAIFVMNTLAVILGMATTVVPHFITHYGSIILFAIFGVKMLYEGYKMTDEEGKEEMEEVQKSITKKESNNADYESLMSAEDPETGIIKTSAKLPLSTRIRRRLMAYVSLVFIETFTMTFLAEWGDRSQISTIILAAREDVIGVGIGALCGHFICTGIAVLGGRIIAQMISVRTVTLIGGVVFIFFSLFAYFGNEGTV